MCWINKYNCCTLGYRVIHRLIQHCLLSKIVYLNIKYAIATRNYKKIYTYAKSHLKFHTFDRYYSCSSTKLRHKTERKVWKCSHTFPLKDGISTFYVSFTI